MQNNSNIGERKPKKRAQLRKRIITDPIDYVVKIAIKYGKNMNGEKIVLFNKNKDTQPSNSLAFQVFSETSHFCYQTSMSLDKFTILQDNLTENVNFPKLINVLLENKDTENETYEPITLDNLDYEIYYEGNEPEPTTEEQSDVLQITNSLIEDNTETTILFLKFLQNGIGSQISNPVKPGETAVYNPVIQVIEGNEIVYKQGVYLGVLSPNNTAYSGISAIDDLDFEPVIGGLDKVFFPVDFSDFVENTDCSVGVTIEVNKIKNRYEFTLL